MNYPLDQYEKNGVAFPLRVLSRERADELAQKVMDTRRQGAEAEQGIKKNAHLLFPWLWDLATSENVLEPVRAVLGPNILIWSSGFFIKDVNDDAFISWHQDSTYWGLEPATIATAWIALTPSTVESGCMNVAPGTHTMEQLPHVDSFAEDNLLSRGQEVAVDVTTLKTVNLELQPGEMSIHHVQLVHGSDPNKASWPRLGYAIRFIPTSVRQVGGRTMAALACGEDRFGHFDLVSRPQGDMDEAAIANATESDKRLNPILMGTM